MKYKVGDKVRIVGGRPKDGSAYQNPEGGMDKWLGKVMTIVGFDYNLGARCYKMAEDKKDHLCWTEGWFWNEACISGLAQVQKVVVTSDGKTTTAKLFNGKELVKSAEAKCSSCDTFDFEKGAALAVDRLLGRDEKRENKKPLNCKVVCVSNSVPESLTCSGFTIGKVYEVRGGRITNDEGWRSIFSCCTIPELSGAMGNQFIEFVE